MNANFFADVKVMLLDSIKKFENLGFYQTVERKKIDRPKILLFVSSTNQGEKLELYALI